jgi:exopolyphosphatase / guanosine-5'-triphosphate,3'-diphosphate pyrophosphatase
MESTDHPPHASKDTAKTVAAIDVGANSLRMVVAEVLPDGRIEVLERLQRAVRLGQDTFRRGRLGAASMRAAVAILRDYQKILALYQVERVRAVATSAVREASNADTFLDRIFIATGLQIEVIGTPEESRLTVSAVRQAVGDALEINRGNTLIADVGGGSTLLTLLQDGEIVSSQSLRLGSIRVQEMLATTQETPERSAELLRDHIANVLSTLHGSLPLASIHSLVAVGGDARFAARQIGRATDCEDLAVVELAAFDKLVDRCERHTTEELAKRYGLPIAEAETLNAALLVYQNVLRLSQSSRMIVSHISMRDGLLLELARAVTGQEDQSLLEGVIHSATAIAEKYHADLRHAELVADAALRLFDELQAEHGLPPRCRLLLQAAGLLHEIGGFVSSRSHHKHSGYLIANSEIFGLNREEIAVVAQVARYHRRSGPKTAHLDYMALRRETRVTVQKLAALLRVADALDRGHLHSAADLRFERQGDDLILCVAGVPDLLLEERAIAAKADLFEDIFGMKVRLEVG